MFNEGLNRQRAPGRMITDNQTDLEEVSHDDEDDDDDDTLWS